MSGHPAARILNRVVGNGDGPDIDLWMSHVATGTQCALNVGAAWHAGAVSQESADENDQAPTDEPIRLVGGLNFTTWADLKWSRGNAHIALLQARFFEWQASAAVSIDAVLRRDCQAIDFTARLPRGIPKESWSLDMGDAIHNLRSALDAVAWGMAHYKDAKPARPKSVYFPVCSDEQQWKKALKDWVGEINPEFQERLRIMQPFTHLQAGEFSILSMLHDLDIQDKHRDVLTVSAHLHEINLSGSFEYEEPDNQAVPWVEMFPDTKLSDGAVLGTMHAGASVRAVGRIILRPAMKVQLTHKEAEHDVIPMLQKFATEIRRCLDFLLLGAATPAELDETKWSPLQTGPPPA
jgi:hypothetical protein